MTKIRRSGSIQSEVPVNPSWPYAVGSSGLSEPPLPFGLAVGVAPCSGGIGDMTLIMGRELLVVVVLIVALIAVMWFLSATRTQ